MTDTGITIFNRRTGKVEPERVYASTFRKLFYQTPAGRFITRLVLRRKCFSVLYGFFMSRASSRRLIRPLMEEYGIDPEEFEKPLSSFTDFNDFFCRTLKPETRPVDRNPERLIAPCDGRLSVHTVGNGLMVTVKGHNVPIEAILADSTAARMYNGGLCLIFRLVPADVHRFFYIDSGLQEPVRALGKYLHVSSPQKIILGHFPIFENYRQLCRIHTENFGIVTQVEIGALAVGCIRQNLPGGGEVKKGSEKGYFRFGSTIMVFIEKNRVMMDDDILFHSRRNNETLVRYGEGIGRNKENVHVADTGKGSV